MTESKIPKGINVCDVWKAKGRHEGKRWLWRVRDSVRRTYVREAWGDYDQGLDWAKGKLAKLAAGVETSNTSLVADVGKAYVASLANRGCTQRHQDQVKQVVDAMAKAGAGDMKALLFPDRVEAWLSTLTGKRHWAKKAKPASPRLKNKFLVIAKALVGYAIDRRLLTHDPLAILKPWAAPRAAKEVFTIPELRDLLATDMEADRWFLFAALGIYTGCRASEIAAMRWSMVDWTANVLRLPADLPGNKAKRHRKIPLQPELAAILRPLAKVGVAIIVPDKVANMSPANVTHGFHDYCGRCGITAGSRGPHALRHTVAALLTAQGMSPFLAMDYLGHSSASVAKDYAASAQEFVRDVATWGGERFYLRDEAPKTKRSKIGR